MVGYEEGPDMALNKVVVWDEMRMDVILAAEYPGEALGRKMIEIECLKWKLLYKHMDFREKQS